MKAMEAMEARKAADEAKLELEKKRAAKRTKADTPINQEVTPKRSKVTTQGTPQSRTKTSAQASPVAPSPIDGKVLQEASKLGMAAALQNLAARPEVVASKKSAKAILDALKSSGGLVNPAKRVLLGL